jgi:oxalate decarboxylase/phosphoglucose isomerase-like protein (cupin superfamily)
VLDGIEHRIKPGFAILVPAGTRHNIINGPSDPMKLYTLYAPPNHHDGVVHPTKAVQRQTKSTSTGRRPNSYPRDPTSPASRKPPGRSHWMVESRGARGQ